MTPAATPSVAELLFLLLRAGLQTDRPGDAAATTRIAARGIDWPALYRLAVEQGVEAIVWDGFLRRRADGTLPPEAQPDRMVKFTWIGAVERTESGYERQRQALGRLTAFFDRNGIRTLLLKGYGASLSYPVPNHRPCGDIDIWLFGEQRRGDALLRRQGIAVDESSHHHTVFHIGGVMVENHYDFLNIHSHLSNRAVEQRLQALAAEGKEERVTLTVKEQEVPLYLPSPDLNALFLLRHAAAHFAAVELVLRQAVDWALFLKRSGSRVDWPALERTAREQNMHRFLHALNRIAVEQIGIDPAGIPLDDADRALSDRVLSEILSPEFSEEPPRGHFLRGLAFKCRRWWTNRWKHRIVYREGLLTTFFVQVWSHLLKPRSLKS